MPSLSAASGGWRTARNALVGALGVGAAIMPNGGGAQPRIPSPYTDAEWAKIEVAARNPILPKICQAINRALIMSLRTPEAEQISDITRNGILNFIENPLTGRADCTGVRYFPWTYSKTGRDLDFLTRAIGIAGEDASSVASVEASRKAGKTVRVTIHLPSAFGIAPAREPVPPEVGSLDRPKEPSGPASGPSG